MATYYPASIFPPQFFNPDDGTLASGFTLEAQLASDSSSTNMFSDKSGTSLGSTITLNASGQPESGGNTVTIWLKRGVEYKFILKDTDSNTEWTLNDISNHPGGGIIEDVLDYTALKALDIAGYSNGNKVSLSYRSTEGDKGHGPFRWDTSDLSTEVTGDPGQGKYVPPDSDTSGASGAWVRLAETITPEMFGVEPNASTSQTTEMQYFLDYIRDNGTPAEGTGATYRLDTAVTLQSASTSTKNYIIDWKGSTIDFSNTALTSGDLFTLGATSAANGHDKEVIEFRNCTMIGPEAAAAHTTNNNTTTCTTLSLLFAFHVRLDNIVVKQSYIGIETDNAYPLHANLIEVRESYIPYKIGSYSTYGVWTTCGAVDSYFSWLIQPALFGDQLSNQTFINPRTENCERGQTIDPLDGSGKSVEGITLINPYYENVTGHHNLHGKAFDFTDALSVGSDRTGDVINCSIIGDGIWSSGAWSASKAPLVCSTTGTVNGATYNIPSDISNVLGTPRKYYWHPRIDANSGIGMDWAPFSSNVGFIHFNGSTGAVANSYGIFDGATINTSPGTGLTDITLIDGFVNASSFVVNGSHDTGTAECNYGASSATVIRIETRDRSATPALVDVDNIVLRIEGELA